MKQSKRVRIGLRYFLDDYSEEGALMDFASGAPLAMLERDVWSEGAKSAVRTMRRLGVDRSRAKVREYLTKQGVTMWKNCIYLHRRLYESYE